MIWIIAALLFGLISWLALRWYANADPALVKRGLAGFVLIFLLVVMVLLLVTGRAPAALPFLIGAFFAYQRLRTGLGLFQFLQRLWNVSSGKTDARKSQIKTEFLAMALDKASGALSGRILKGLYSGQDLAKLSQQELIEKYNELRRLDFESARLLETFLDRTQGASWRAQTQGQSGGPSDAAPDNAVMTLQRAASVLGVDVGAPRDAVVAAHKRLMKIAHPDQGGSDFLAQQINVAKDVLLKSRD